MAAGTPTNPTAQPPQVRSHCCLKGAVVLSYAAGITLLVLGVLAFAACQGAGSSSFASWSKVGSVNSYVMMGGGLLWGMISLAAWGLHLKHQHGPLRARVVNGSMPSPR